MIEDLDPFIDRYDEVIAACTRCNAISYKASPHLLIPRFHHTDPEFIDRKSYFIINSGTGTAPLVIPVEQQNPKEYLQVLIKVVHEYGGVFDISKPYADVLEKHGYKKFQRPWGYTDFVFSTEHLSTLPGKRWATARNYFRRYVKGDFTQRHLTSADCDQVDALELRWRAPKDAIKFTVGNKGNAALFLNSMADLPSSMRAHAIGNFDGETLIGVAMGCILSDTHWVRGYGYGDPDRKYNSINLHSFHELAKLYLDHEFECDGDGGGVGTPLYTFKQRLLTDSVLNKQKFSFVIKNK